jgi:hypothetical protein
MSKLFFWCWVFWLGFMIAAAGMGYAEDPSNSLLIGALILYSGIGIVWVAVIQLIKRGG